MTRSEHILPVADRIKDPNYWIEGRYVDGPDKFPKGADFKSHAAMLRKLHKLGLKSELKTLEVKSGIRTPALTAAEGMIALLVDSYRREDTWGVLSYMHIPTTIPGTAAGVETLNVIAQAMEDDPLYSGDSVRLKASVTRGGGWTTREEWQRDLMYVTSAGVEGWFSGLYSRSMNTRLNHGLRSPINYAEIYAPNVGDIICQDSTGKVDALYVRTKIAAATLHLL